MADGATEPPYSSGESPRPLSHLGAIGFIGAGAVGATLARVLAACGADIRMVSARHLAHIGLLTRTLPGHTLVGTPEEVVAACDLVFLAVPDDAILPLAESLPWRAEQGVVHLSGARPAAALAACSALGAHPAALHPLMTFPRYPLDAPIAPMLERVRGCTWALEAENSSLAGQLEAIVAALDGRIVRLAATDRVPYHISGVLASNYVAALLGTGASLWQGFGVERADAVAALLPLLRATVESLADVGLPGALTGPVARGDAGTVAAHLAWLDAHAAVDQQVATLRDAYIALARLAIPIARQKGTLSEEAIGRLEKALSSSEEPGTDGGSALMERCIPWNPVPAEANRYFAFQVFSLVHNYRLNAPALLLGLVTEHSDGSHTYSVTIKWKLTFENVVAYRHGILEAPLWAHSLPRHEDRDIAAYEVSPSSWLDVCVPTAYPHDVHHYVLLSDYEVYEIAAESWSSQLMTDDWNGLEP